MTNEAGLEFNRCKWRAEKGTVSQENGASDALERLAKDIFDFTIVREPMAIQKDIDLLKFTLHSELSLKNDVSEKQNSLSGVGDRQSAQAKAETVDLDAMHDHFEKWMTANGDYPHLIHKHFGGNYLHEETSMKWDGFKQGVKYAQR